MHGSNSERNVQTDGYVYMNRCTSICAYVICVYAYVYRYMYL